MSENDPLFVWDKKNKSKPKSNKDAITLQEVYDWLQRKYNERQRKMNQLAEMG